MQPSRTAPLDLALNGLLLAAAGWFAWTCFSGATAHSNGFPSYYTAASLLRGGVSPAPFYDNDWFGQQVQRFDPGMREIFAPNPPTTALLLLPLCGLPLFTARLVWTALNAALLLACGVGLQRALGLRGRAQKLLWLFALAGLPVRMDLLLGQAHLVTTALWVLVLLHFMRGQDRRLGGVLAALMLLKTGGALLWLVLGVQRRWRALGWAAGSLALGVAACWPWVGWDAWSAYLRVVPPQLGAPWIAVTAHQSVPSLLMHLGRFDASFNPTPLVDAPALVAVLSAAAAAALSGAVLFRAWRGAPPERAVAAVVLTQLLLVPVSAEYHYAVALVPLAVLLMWRSPSRGERVALVAGGLLLSLNLHHHSPRLVDGARALLAYPLLYGALLWLGLLLRAPRAPGAPPAGP